jgi:hypothetical protein
MKKNEKRMILILLIILAIVIIAVVVGKNKGNKENTEKNQVKEEFVQVQEDGTKVNISSKLAETKTVGAYKIGNIQLTTKDNQSILLADVENVSSSATEMKMIEITLLDKEGNTLETVPGVVKQLQPGETAQLNAGITDDYANSYDFKVEVK